MLRTILLMVFILPILLLRAQDASPEMGIIFAPRMQGETDFGIKINGFSLEGGMYYTLPMGERLSLSLNARLGYTYADRQTRGTLSINDILFNRGDTIPMRNGSIQHRNFYLSAPIQLRWRPLRKSQVYLLVAIHPEFNLWHSSDWYFDQYEWDSGNNTRTLLETGLAEELSQNFYASALSFGVGHSWKGWRAEIEMRLGAYELDSSYFDGMNYQAIGLALYRPLKL